MQMPEFHSKVSGFAAYLPPNIISTEVTVPNGTLPWGIDFKRLTRIQSHHEVLENQGSLELAVEASRKAIKRSGVALDEIDLVINCSVSQMSSACENLVDPCMASLVSNKLGIRSKRSFDVLNACSGMVTGMMIADANIKSGECRNVLIISGEFISSAIYEAKRLNLRFNMKAMPSMTVGDAGAAYVLSRSEEPKLGFLSPMTFAQHEKYCIAEAAKSVPGAMMRTEGRKLQSIALKYLPIYLKREFDANELIWDDYEHVISHQTTPKAVAKGGVIAAELFGHCKNNRSIDHTGNTASTSHAVVLETLLEKGELKSNQKTYLMSFGSGFVMIGMHLEIPQGVEQW